MNTFIMDKIQTALSDNTKSKPSDIFYALSSLAKEIDIGRDDYLGDGSDIAFNQMVNPAANGIGSGPVERVIKAAVKDGGFTPHRCSSDDSATPERTWSAFRFSFLKSDVSPEKRTYFHYLYGESTALNSGQGNRTAFYEFVLTFNGDVMGFENNHFNDWLANPYFGGPMGPAMYAGRPEQLYSTVAGFFIPPTPIPF